MTDTHLFVGPALRVQQPLGTFVIATIPWQVLDSITYPDPLRLATSSVADPRWAAWRDAGRLEGTQRRLEQARLKEIGRFIGTFDATFPNAIILAVPESEYVAGEPGDGADWELADESDVDARVTLKIPQKARLAVVVDGQHRLYAFGHAGLRPEQEFGLVCSVFFGLPAPMQAMIFATINTNQKPVRRGLAMNLYGYNLEDEDETYWSPEKLAVFLARRLNFDKASPLAHAIRVEARGAPEASLVPGAARPITMVSVVDGIMGLISRKPREDRDTLRLPGKLFAHRSARRELKDDGSPLRDWYREGHDADLYDLVVDFFRVVRTKLWANDPVRFGKLTRSVGVRALFGLLRAVAARAKERTSKAGGLKAAVAIEWQRVVDAVAVLDFTDSYFEANDAGRRRIQLLMSVTAGLMTIAELPEADSAEIARRVAAARRAR